MRILSAFTLSCILFLGLTGAAHALGIDNSSVCDELTGPFTSSCTMARGSNSKKCIVRCTGDRSYAMKGQEQYTNTVTKIKAPLNTEDTWYCRISPNAPGTHTILSIDCATPLKNDNGVLKPVE